LARVGGQLSIGSYFNLVGVAVEQIPKAIARNQDFNAQLSKACDLVYKKIPVLKNEPINRRELTDQAVKAMQILIEAILNHPKQEWLGQNGLRTRDQYL